jgi:hypothetical protein
MRQAVRELEDSLPGSACAVAARTSSCAPCTAAAVVLALIQSSLASAADPGLSVKAVLPLPIRPADRSDAGVMWRSLSHEISGAFPGLSSEQEPTFCTVRVRAAYRFYKANNLKKLS